MTSLYYLFLPLILLVILFSAWLYLTGKKNIPVALYVEALRNENSGQLEAAVINYENALLAVQKVRFPDITLRNKIIDRLKVLHTIIEYNNSFHFIR
jgi:hypothetical protein